MGLHSYSRVKRITTLLISGALVFSLCPMRSFAEEPTDNDAEDSFEYLIPDNSVDDNVAGNQTSLDDSTDQGVEVNDGQANDTDQPKLNAPAEEIIDEGSSTQHDEGIETGESSSDTQIEVAVSGDAADESELEPETPLDNDVDQLETQASRPSVSYATHVQNVGWQADVKDGKMAGTSGRSLRLESFHVKLVLPKDHKGGIEYRAQVQNKGWLTWVKDGVNCGTTGSSLRMEAIQIRLYGQIADDYDVYYRVHLQNYGWMSWARNGELSGSTGNSLRLEALQVVLVPKGENPPTENPSSQSVNAFVDGTTLAVSAHVQNVGWMKPVGSGKVAGTTGRSLRVEALRVSLSGARVPGGITGQAHVQNVGWQNWVGNGGVAGTSGRSLRVEAIRYKLTGEAAGEWDLYYRVHVQNVGWLAWAKNGEAAGSEGFSLRVEAVEFRLVPKGGSAPKSDGSTGLAFLSPLGVSYAARVDGAQWGKTVTNGETAGTTGKSKVINGLRILLSPSEEAPEGSIFYDLDVEGGVWAGWKSDGEVILTDKRPEAIRIKLSGELSKDYSVWYRVHLSNAGWLGWAKDGQIAGTSETGIHIEAYQVRILPKATGAPGSTTLYYLKYGASLSGDVWLDNYVLDMIETRGWSGYEGLRQSYEFVRNHTYISMSHWPGGNTDLWSRPFAKEFVQRNGGNCHRFAALQYWFAKALGFDARLMTGQWHNSTSTGDHSWVEITYKGTVYVVDAQLACPSAYPEFNWFMIRYKDARLKYYDLSDRRILR